MILLIDIRWSLLEIRLFIELIHSVLKIHILVKTSYHLIFFLLIPGAPGNRGFNGRLGYTGATGPSGMSMKHSFIGHLHSYTVEPHLNGTSILRPPWF